MMHRVFLLLASSRLVFGQPDASSITVTATRTIYAQPDQVLFAVYVASNADAALDSVVAALAGLGITAANLSSVSGSGRAVQDGVPGVNLGSPLQWIFTLPAPLAKLKDTIASLATLQQTISQKNAGLSMTFSVQGTQASPQPCSTPDLISDARAQAQQLANAAGVTVGPVIGISVPTPSSFPEEIVPILFIPTIVTPVLSLSAYFSATIPPVPIAPTNCSLVVQFRMLL